MKIKLRENIYIYGTYNMCKGYMCVSGRHETCAVLSLIHDILDYEDQYCCLQGAAVETLCNTGCHVRVQIDSILRKFCRLTTPSKGVHTTQGMDAADARIELKFIQTYMGCFTCHIAHTVAYCEKWSLLTSLQRINLNLATPSSS